MANENESGSGDVAAGAGAGGEAAAAASAAAAATAAKAGAGGDQGGGAAAGAGAAGGADAAAIAAAAAAKAGGTKELGWGETWRTDFLATKKDMSEDDKGKLLKRLERYPSLAAALDGGIAAQNKINEVGLKKPLSGKETPEQLAEYRKENGIPETPAGYLENLPQGLVIGDADKPLFEDFVKGLHGLNADPKIAQYAVKWYNDFQEKAATEQIAADEAAKATTEDVLRTEYGNDYRTNINSIHGLLDGAPKEVSEALLNARAGDGKAIMNDPQVVRWLVGLAREINPVHTIVPGSGGNPGQGLEEAIGAIEKVMREDRPAYNRDLGMQKRLLELYGAREKLASRSA